MRFCFLPFITAHILSAYLPGYALADTPPTPTTSSTSDRSSDSTKAAATAILTPAIAFPSTITQPSIDDCQTSSWYCGVSLDRRKRASVAYDQGNKLFDELLFTSAEAKYREALTHWDHPGIHYNLMLTLVALQRPVDAYLSSMEALRHGESALPPEDLQRVEDHQKLLRGRVVEITVECSEPEADIKLDGQTFLKGPGRKKTYVLIGRHELVATKPGYLPTIHAFTVTSTKAIHINLGMLSNDEAWVDERRFTPATPWLAVGAGALLGVAGGIFEWRARANNRAFQRAFRNHCPIPHGCKRSELTARMKSYEHRHRWFRRIGHGGLIAGSTAIAGGLWLVYLNRPYQVENPARHNRIRISAQPLISPSTTGAAMKLHF